MSDGNLIRVPLPELSEERRKELVKVAAKYAEQARVSARNVRREGMESLKKQEKDGKLSQDQHRKLEKDVQTLTDDTIKKRRCHVAAEGQGDTVRSDGERTRSRISPAPPAHVAIIMDGNGRWAKKRGLPRIAGHKNGAEAVRRAVAASVELGIKYLTLFGFSSENWKRPAGEIDDLMGLLRHYLRGEIAELHKNGVRVRVIGERDKLAPDIVTLIDNAENLTRGNERLHLSIALNYGGRAEIALGRARHRRGGRRRARSSPDEIDEDCLRRAIS